MKKKSIVDPHKKVLKIGHAQLSLISI